MVFELYEILAGWIVKLALWILFWLLVYPVCNTLGAPIILTLALFGIPKGNGYWVRVRSGYRALNDNVYYSIY